MIESKEKEIAMDCAVSILSEEVYDFIGYCVVVNDTNSCYKTLEEIINSNKIVIKE